MENTDKRKIKGNDTKNRIIRVSEELFSKKGYDATSIKDITDLAKIPKSLFYHYFKSKDELLKWMIELYNLRISDEDKDAKLKSNELSEIASKVYQKIILDKDMLKIIMMEALKNDEILNSMIKKLDILGEDFNDLTSDSIKNLNSKDEMKIFRFYFRFIPQIMFALTNDSVSEYYKIPSDELTKHFLNLLKYNPYLSE